jgi:hypothetical protein
MLAISPNLITLLRSIPASKISLPFSIFPTSFLPFFSLFYTYPISPFPFSLLFSLSSFILSHFFRTTGSWVGRLTNPHLQSTSSHIESVQPPHYPILSRFCNRGSRVGGVKLSYPMFRDIHFASKRSMIYILTPRLPELPSISFLLC